MATISGGVKCASGISFDGWSSGSSWPAQNATLCPSLRHTCAHFRVSKVTPSVPASRVETKPIFMPRTISHPAVPALKIPQRRQLGLAVVEIVAENPVQIVIHEQRLVGDEVGRRREHVVDGAQAFRELSDKLPAITRPLLNAAFAELAFLVPKLHHTLNQRQRRQ